MKSLVAVLCMTTLATPLLAQDKAVPPLKVVPTVDLKQYAGTWYEIARLPNRFQDHCAGDVTATYTLLDDGEIMVVNRCSKNDGSISQVEGRAKRASEDGPLSKLKVRFAPAFLSFLPFVWGDYWILELATDYSHVVIGEPGREYLWVLARTPSMDETELQQVLTRVKEQGYDISSLIRTKQSRHD